MNLPGRSRLVGIVVGLGIAHPIMYTSYFNLAPIALAIPIVLGVLIGQSLTPRPARVPGSASLRTRRIGDYLPRRALTTPAVLTALATPAVALAVIGQPLEQPGSYRVYGHDVQTIDPYYLIGTLIVVLTITAITIWLVVRAPSGGDDQTSELWRRQTVAIITDTSLTLLSMLVAAILLLYAGQEMDWRAAGYPPLGVGFGILGATCLMLFAWHAIALVTASKPDQQ